MKQNLLLRSLDHGAAIDSGNSPMFDNNARVQGNFDPRFVVLQVAVGKPSSAK